MFIKYDLLGSVFFIAINSDEFWSKFVDLSLSMINLSFDVAVKFFPWNSFGVVATNWMNDVQKLKFGIAILKFIINVFEIFELKFSFAFIVYQIEVRSSSFFSPWISLNKRFLTILLVSSLTNCSKSRACPSFNSWIS